LEAREPKEVEDPRTVIFVRGTRTGEVVKGAMKDLVRGLRSNDYIWIIKHLFFFFLWDVKIALKRPFATSFSKKNVVRPFEDAASLEFWAHKNDASMFVLGQSTKKRPNGLTIARMFDGKLLDMCELGVDQFVGMDEFKVCDQSLRLSFSTSQIDRYDMSRHQNHSKGTSPCYISPRSSLIPTRGSSN